MQKTIKNIDKLTMMSLEAKAKAAGMSVDELILDILDVAGRYIHPNDGLYPYIKSLIGQTSEELSRIQRQFSSWDDKTIVDLRKAVDPLTILDCLLHLKLDLMHAGIMLNKASEASSEVE